MTSDFRRHAFSAMRVLGLLVIVAISSNPRTLSAEPAEVTVRYVLIVLETKSLMGETHELTAHVCEKDLQELALTPAMVHVELDKFFDAFGKRVVGIAAKMAAEVLFGERDSKVAAAESKPEPPPLDPRMLKLLGRGVLIELRVTKNGKLTKFERQLLKISDAVEMKASTKPSQSNELKGSNE